MNNKLFKMYMKFQVFVLIFAFFINMFNFCGGFANAENHINSSAKSMVIIEKNSGRILFSKNENERLPMASLTKIITAIYVIKNEKNIDRIVEIEENMTGVEGSSIGLKTGEHLSIRELLYGLMLRSGNDSAVALAYSISGSIEQFVYDVNTWLSDLGFKNTNIKNPHGLHDDNHYTTALELANITAMALNNEIFQEIVSTKEKSISNELNSKTSRNLKNKNRFLKDYEFADGVKTGFTKKAGRCFVGSSTKDGMQVICVLLNCVPMFEECEYFTRKAFDEFKLEKVISSGQNLGKLNVKNSKEQNIEVVFNKDFYYPLRVNEKNDIKVNFTQRENIIAPIKECEDIGVVEITFKNQLIFSDKIYSIKYIKSNTLGSEFKRIIDKMF